jgi:hypothetical protein
MATEVNQSQPLQGLKILSPCKKNSLPRRGVYPELCRRAPRNDPYRLFFLYLSESTAPQFNPERWFKKTNCLPGLKHFA